MCAACPTPRLNQSYELRPPWEQHLRYVPHRVRNGHNSAGTHEQKINFPSFTQIQKFTDPVFTIRKDGKCLEIIKIVKVSRFQFPCKTKHYCHSLSLPQSFLRVYGSKQ